MDIEQFGQQIKKKYPQYQDFSDKELGERMLKKYPQYKDKIKKDMTLQGLFNNLGRNTVETASSLPQLLEAAWKTYNVASPTGNKKNVLEDVNTLKDAASAGTKQTFSDVKDFVSDPVDFAYERPLDTALYGAGAANIVKPVFKGAKSTTNFLKSPKKTVGGKLENIYKEAGEIPAGTLEKYFGTKEPNPSLYEGLSSAAGKQKLIDLLRREMATQGRSSGGVFGQPTYADIQNLKKGAYAQAYDKLVPKAQQGLYKNIGRVYKEILNEGVPQAKGMESLYGILSKGKGVVDKGVKAIPYTVGTGATYALLKLLGF